MTAKDRHQRRVQPPGMSIQSAEWLMGRDRTLWWSVGYLALSTFLVVAVWPHLANFPPVSADEVWIMSASFKLATEGVLGSDLFAGLHGADRHYFLNLPVQHLIQAAFFRVFGSGILQARGPSVLAAIIVLCAAGWLAYKWAGLGCSLTTGILLLFWRSNLLAADPRPPLLALAQSGRYDVVVLCFWWLVLLMIDRHLDQPRRSTALAAGILAGITVVTQFYGAGVLLCCIAAFFWARRQAKAERLYARASAIGAAIPIVIYATYVAAHMTDFIGQASLLSYRIHFYAPQFYLTNLVNEWRRFGWLRYASRDVVGAWIVMLAIPLSFLTAAKLLRGGNALALISALGAFLSLALLDSIKARIYGSLLLPVLCFGLAAALAPTLFAVPRRPWIGAQAVAGWALLIWIVVDGLGGYRFVADEGPRVVPYADVGQRIATSFGDRVPILGSQRWWWALHGLPYRSLNAQWQIWDIEQRSDHEPDFKIMLESLGGAYLILDNDTRGDLTRVSPRLRQQVNDILASRAERVASWMDPTYGLIEIYRF